MIDWGQMVTADAKAAAALAARKEAVHAECSRRIYAVVDAHAQINLAAAAAAGVLSAADMATYRAGVAWIDATRRACAPLITGGEIADDAAWPAPTQAMRDLTGRF